MLPEMVRYEPTWEELELLKDGGVAIIDQWICAHARYNVLPCSASSFLIYESCYHYELTSLLSLILLLHQTYFATLMV